MKKYLFLLSFILIPSAVYANTYAVNDDSEAGVKIVRVIDGNIEEELAKIGLSGKPYFEISESSLPPREDRKYWKIQGNTVVVDETAKKNDVYSRLDEKYVNEKLYERLAPERTIQLSPYLGSLNAFMQYKNLPGLRDYIDALQVSGIATSEESVMVRGIFKELDIDLDNLPNG